jgi:Bacterial Ig domain
MKSCILSFLTFFICFSLTAQNPLSVPFTESFNTGLNGWRVKTPPTSHYWQWYNNVGTNSDGGLRMKHPFDSNYVASPAIALLAGKTYTVSFKARMDQGTTDRLVKVGTNPVRSLMGTNVFFTTRLPTDSYKDPLFTEYNPTFTVPTSGNYYLIFNFTENGYAFNYFDEVTVEETQYPSVSITSPTEGGSTNENYIDSTKVLIDASASDTDGTITKVEFFANGVKIAEKTTAPFQFIWKDVLPKDYAFTAKATDNRGNTTISEPVNYRVNFRDGTLKPYVHWDFNSTNTIGKNLDYWTLLGGDWKLRGGGFHNTNYLDNFSAYAKNCGASPGFYLQAGNAYKLEFLAQTLGKIIKLYLSKTQTLNDTIYIGKEVIGANNVKENFDVIHQKNITVTQSGVYYLILHYPIVDNYIQVHFDNIRIIGDGLNIAPLSKITAPNRDIVAAENASLSLNSEVLDLDGTIQKVEYYANATKVGESSVPPTYEAIWANMPRGKYSITARPIDNQNAQASSLITTVVADTNRFSVSSLIGGVGDDDIRGIVFQRNGTIVMAANMSNLSHLNLPTQYLNGATADSSGVIIRLTKDGKSILSFTRLCTKVADLSKDLNDNLYVAAWKSGIFKLNATADSIRWKKIFTNPVHRIDAGPSGKNICMTAIETDIDDGTLTQTRNYLHDENGTLIYQYSGVSQYGADVAIDEVSKTAIMVGFKNFNTFDKKGGTKTLPVYVPVVRGRAYEGSDSTKYVGYDWSSDTTSTRWLNRSNNNMADARLNRCVIGKDGKLYIAGQVYGGNHCFRYSPFDIMQGAILVGGDHYFTLSNTGTESHVFVGCYDPATGVQDRGQTFTARLPSPFKGNSVFIDRGGLDADSSGRVYLTGASAWGLPLTTDYVPGEYTGGAYALVLSPNMATRVMCTRLAFGYGRAIAVYDSKKWAFGGYSDQGQEYLVNSLQATNLSTTTKNLEGWFGIFNNFKCLKPETKITSQIPTGTFGNPGNWNVPSTWECGTIPTATSPVMIETGHTVTIPSGYTGKAFSLELKGILKKEIGSEFEIKR